MSLEPRRMSPLKKFAIGAVALAGVWGYGHLQYNSGVKEGSEPVTRLEQLAHYDTAPGFLEYPGIYTIRAELNEQHQTESYLRNKSTGAEVPFSDRTWEFLDAYRQHPKTIDMALGVAKRLPGGD